MTDIGGQLVNFRRSSHGSVRVNGTSPRFSAMSNLRASCTCNIQQRWIVRDRIADDVCRLSGELCVLLSSRDTKCIGRIRSRIVV